MAQAELPHIVLQALNAGDTTAVVVWLDGGGDVNATSDMPDGSVRGFTMLMFACIQGNEQLVAALIERGAALDAQDSTGGTALMCAAIAGRASIVRRLLQAGAQPGLRNKGGGTALQYAERRGHTECVLQLIRLGGTVDGVYAQDGTTALTCAALRGRLDIVKLLVVRPNRKTPLDLVVESLRLVRYLDQIRSDQIY